MTSSSLRATKVVAWQPGSSFKQKLIFRTWHLRFRSQTLGYWGMEFSEIGIGSKRLLGQFYLTINTRQKYLTILISFQPHGHKNGYLFSQTPIPRFPPSPSTKVYWYKIPPALTRAVSWWVGILTQKSIYKHVFS